MNHKHIDGSLEINLELELGNLQCCVCCVPFWNMCHPETFFRLAWCAVLKNMHFWYTFQICIEGRKQYVCLTQYIWRSPFLLLKNKQMQFGLTYGLFFKSFLLQDLAFNMWLWYDKVCTVQIWNMYQKCTFSERHIMSIWNMFQDGTCFRMARNTCDVSYFLTLVDFNYRVDWAYSLLFQCSSTFVGKRAFYTADTCYTYVTERTIILQTRPFYNDELLPSFFDYLLRPMLFFLNRINKHKSINILWYLSNIWFGH